MAVGIRVAARRAAGLVAFRVGSIVLPLLPLDRAYRLARWHGRRHYRRQRDRLRPHASEMAARLGAGAAQVDSWLARYFELAASEKLDKHLYQRLDRAGIDRLIQLRGLEHLREALSHGHGAILYSGHVMGHFTFFVALGLHGYRLNMIGFPEHEQWVATRQNAFMERRLGFTLLRMQRANFGIAVKAANALRANGIVTVEIDQTTSTPMVETEFLGSPGYFPLGPALIARASGAPLLPFWVNRPPEWAPQIAEIGRPIFVDGDPSTAVRRCAAEIEKAIRRDPPTWLPWVFSEKLVWSGRDSALDGLPAS